MTSELHGTVINYTDIKDIPSRNAFLDKNIFNETQEIISKGKELLFMPNDLHEMHIQEKKYQKSLYKIVLFGVFQDGRKATVVLSGIMPYFEVVIPDKINNVDNDVSENALYLFEKLKQCKYACPEKFEIIKGKTFKGYQKNRKTFARFFFNKLKTRKEAIKFVTEQGYETTTNDTSCYYRIVCRDYQISFSSWITINNYDIKNH